MMDIVKTLEKSEGFVALIGATQEEINTSEEVLGLKFAEEYRDYISKYGVASIEGHEYTGIVKSSRLNVVDVTVKAWNRNANITHDYYVVEEMGIDGLIIWQNGSGEIFQTANESKPEKIFDSFASYINDRDPSVTIDYDV